MNDDVPVTQDFVERDFGDKQALSNFVDAQLRLLAECLGDNGRALRFVP